MDCYPSCFSLACRHPWPSAVGFLKFLSIRMTDNLTQAPTWPAPKVFCRYRSSLLNPPSVLVSVSGSASALASAREKLVTPIEREKFDTIGGGVGPFLERIQQFRRRRRVQRTCIEYSLAVREDFTPTSFYARDAYFRGIMDVGFIFEDSEEFALEPWFLDRSPLNAAFSFSTEQILRD